MKVICIKEIFGLEVGKVYDTYGTLPPYKYEKFVDGKLVEGVQGTTYNLIGRQIVTLLTGQKKELPLEKNKHYFSEEYVKPISVLRKEKLNELDKLF